MRNFKLLLATTAILSTTLTANVWADGEAPANPTGTIQAHVGLFRADEITVLQHMEFGALLATGIRTSDVNVRLEPSTGNLVITGAGVEKAGDDFHTAYIAVAVPTGYTATINLPEDSVELVNETSLGVLNLTPEIMPESDMDHGDYKINYYNIGGTIVIGQMQPFDGDYVGSFVVTAVLTEDTTPSSGD